MANSKSNVFSLNFKFVVGLFLSSLLFMTSDNAVATDDDHSSFSYDTGAANGPENWAKLNPKWTLCGNGSRQSPINIVEVVSGLSSGDGDLNVQYKSAQATIENRGNNIEVTWTGDAGRIIVSGSKYNLQQCHWHISSEHAINGTRHDMEMHIVHRNSHQDIVVTSIMYRLGSQNDSFISRISPHLRSVNRNESDLGEVDPRDIMFQIGLKYYYTYNGSLTTPPCSENVKWILFKKVRSVSSHQINELMDAVGNGGKKNARPLQQLNRRNVYSFG